MKQNEDGTYFARFQFDQQFKGNIDDVKYEMTIVKVHTEKTGNDTKIRFCKLLINLDGVFPKEFGEELYRLFIDRMKNKPKCYGT